jgi:hypothetical protein
MTAITTDRIIATLHVFEAGATATQIATLLGARKATITSRLSKMWLYGQIDRETIVRGEGRLRRRIALYSAKPVPVSEVSARRAA